MRFAGIILAASLGLVPFLSARADDPPKPPPPQIVQPKSFHFDVTPEEANILGQGLMELPMKTALPVLQKLQAQSSQQTAEEAKKAAEATKAPEPEKK